MKTGLSITDLAAKITENQKSARDFLVPSTQLHMAPAKERGILATFAAANDGQALGLLDLAHDQVAQYVEIPRPYYRRCLQAAPALLCDNLNHWLRSMGDEPRLVRTLSGDVRALLSNRYHCLDNFDLAQAVLPIIANEGLTIESCDLTERRLYIKAVNPRVRAEVAPGDIVEAGVLIQNSEVGCGSLAVVPLVHRLVCKNGLVVNEAATRKRHTGSQLRATGEDYEVYTDDTRKKMDAALWSQIGDLTRAAITDVRFQQVVGKMRDAQGGSKIRLPERAVEVLRKKQDLSEGEASGILAHLTVGGDLSKWGLVNAVTRTAQDVESYDRSTDLERLGGQILDMNSREFGELAV